MGTSTREKMCEVTSFCCGCADLRKGALIIGSLNLFFAVIQVAYNGYLLIAVQDPAVLRQLQAQGTSVEHAWLVSLILGLLVGASVIRAVVNVLLIMSSEARGRSRSHSSMADLHRHLRRHRTPLDPWRKFLKHPGYRPVQLLLCCHPVLQEGA